MRRNIKNRKPMNFGLLCAIWMPIVIIIFVLITIIVMNFNYKIWQDNILNSVEIKANSMINLIQELVNDEEALTVNNQITIDLAARDDQEKAYIRLIDRVTEKTITDSKLTAFISVSNEEIEPQHEYNRFKMYYSFIIESGDALKWMKNIREEQEKKYGKNSLEHYTIFYVDEFDITDSDFCIPHGIYAFNLDTETNEKCFIDYYDDSGKSPEEEKIDEYLHSGGREIHLVGTNLNADDFHEVKDFAHFNDKHYSGGAGESHYWDYNPLTTNYRLYNKSFLKGDMVCIRRVPFSTKGIVQQSNAEFQEFVLEYYYMDNFWDYSKEYILPKVYTYFGIYIILSFIILFIIHKRKMFKYEKEAYRRTLTDSISHDLKSPLTALRGYAESLKENLNEDKRVQYSDAILESADYMNHLINGNIELLRLEDMGSVGKKEVVDFVKLSKSLLEKYNPALEERGIMVEVSGEYEKKVNKELITNALENLISNSVKYVSDNGAISILGDKDGYTISNTTDALPDKKPKELWETFVKGDDSRSNEKGSGLGLAIAKQIFDKHKIKAKINYKKETNSFEVNLS